MNKEEFLNTSNSIKEVISNMPQTTKKNKQKYLAYLKEQLDKYIRKKEELVSELKTRYDEISTREIPNDINYEEIAKEKEIAFNKLLILNEYNSPYEKIGLDKIVYNINHYYEENLESLNKEIQLAINCFTKIGVKLSNEDFWFSDYLKDYMQVYLSENDNNKVKQKLDEIYWKSPNIINEIAMSIIELYNKHEKEFKSYFQKEKNNILKDITYQELIKKHTELANILKEKDYSIDIIANNFINNVENAKDYENDKYDIYISTISNNTIELETLDKLFNTLYEYKIYQEYKFIIEKFLEIYKEKDKQKNVYKNLEKEITKQEKKIRKINKQIKLQQKWFKKQEKIEILKLSLSNEINILKEKYQDYDITKINELISTLNNNTTYFDILKIISSSYTYLRKILEENNNEITDEEVDNKQKFLEEFLFSNKLTILDNINLLNDTNISNIISNRYKLLNLKLESEEIESNIDSIIETLNKIKKINIINNSKVNIKEIEFQTEAKKIIDDQKN